MSGCVIPVHLTNYENPFFDLMSTWQIIRFKVLAANSTQPFMKPTFFFFKKPLFLDVACFTDLRVSTEERICLNLARYRKKLHPAITL